MKHNRAKAESYPNSQIPKEGITMTSRQFSRKRIGQAAERFFMALMILSMGAAFVSGMVFGFTIDDVLNDLWDAGRWSNTPGSLVEQRERGLGGGIEYAIADDFCDNLIPRFIDEPKPTCEQLKEVIQRTFDRWAAGHPILKFTNVTDKIRPVALRADVGAEIDIFAMPYRAGAWTHFWFRRTSPIGTNGKALTGNTLTSADIIFNTNACFHQDPALTGRCNHFESLLLHEIGHALGLDHPNEFPDRNYDTDNDPTNVIPIDCEDPTRGLQVSPNIDPKAVMNSSLGRPHPVLLELTNDDLGGRNFLYPICPSASVDAVSTGWVGGQARPVSGDYIARSPSLLRSQ